MFCSSLLPLLLDNKEDIEKLEKIKNDFSKFMSKEMQLMWAKKLGLEKYDETLTNELFNPVSYTHLTLPTNREV